MAKIIECVPNFSEGRDKNVIDQIVKAIASAKVTVNGNEEGVKVLDLLEPCGNGNPKPQLCITSVRLVSVTPIGGGRHLRMHVAKVGYNFECIFFSCSLSDLPVRPGEWVDLAFCLCQ